MACLLSLFRNRCWIYIAILLNSMSRVFCAFLSTIANYCAAKVKKVAVFNAICIFLMLINCLRDKNQVPSIIISALWWDLSAFSFSFGVFWCCVMLCCVALSCVVLDCLGYRGWFSSGNTFCSDSRSLAWKEIIEMRTV